MPKANKVNVKEKVDDNVCDLSLCELREIPIKEIVSWKNFFCQVQTKCKVEQLTVTKMKTSNAESESERGG